MVEGGSGGAYALGQIFEQAEEVISSEQVERVLTPVIQRIMSGEFDHLYRRRQSVQWFPYLLCATAMVAVMVVALIAHIDTIRLVVDTGTVVETLEYVEVSVTDGGVALFEQTVPDYAFLLRGDIRNVELAIAGRYDSRLLGRSGMGDDNTYRFDPLPDGSYRALAMLPTTAEHVQGIEIGRIFVADGQAQLMLSEGLENFWEGVEIRICLTGS